MNHVGLRIPTITFRNPLQFFYTLYVVNEITSQAYMIHASSPYTNTFNWIITSNLLINDKEKDMNIKAFKM